MEDVFADLEPFARLEPNLRAQMGAVAQLRTYITGDVIVQEKDVGDRLFIIRTGRVEVVETRDGRDQVLAVLGPGDVFGEIAVLEDTARTATVRALEAMTCLVIEGSSLLSVLSEAPEQRREFDLLIARRLGIRAPRSSRPGASE